MGRNSHLRAVAAVFTASPVLLLAPTIEAAQCTLKSPVPQGCGIRGHFAPPVGSSDPYCPIYEPQFVSNFEECADLCDRRQYNKTLHQIYDPDVRLSYCSSFRYSYNTKLCQLSRCHNISRKKWVIPHKKSEDAFFDLNCFQCPPVCQQPYGTQLIDNGDFEKKLFGPWDAKNANIRKGHDSDHAYHCRLGACRLMQFFNVCLNQSPIYRFKFDYVVVSSPKAENPLLAFGVGNIEYEMPMKNTDPHAWNTMILFDKPQPYPLYNGGYSGGLMEFSFAGGVHDGYIDNVQVSRVPSSPNLISSRKSVIKNGGFESGDLLPWHTSHPEIVGISSPGINSKYAITWRFNNSTPPDPFLEQTLTMKPNTTYLFSFDLLGDPDLKGSHITARVYYPSGGRLSIDRYIPNGKNKTFSFQVYSIESSIKMSITPYFVSTITLDNFKMVEIDQPEYFP